MPLISDATGIFVGTNRVNKVYAGSQQVWPNTSGFFPFERRIYGVVDGNNDYCWIGINTSSTNCALIASICTYRLTGRAFGTGWSDRVPFDEIPVGYDSGWVQTTFLERAPEPFRGCFNLLTLPGEPDYGIDILFDNGTSKSSVYYSPEKIADLSGLPQMDNAWLSAGIFCAQ